MKSFLTIIISVFLISCQNNNSIKTKAELLSVLKNTAEKGEFFYGHQEDLYYGHAWVNENRSDTKDVCGAYPAVLGVDVGRIEHGSKSSIDKVPFVLVREKII
jgi:mannan endo-1,4-beta-mannosidase